MMAYVLEELDVVAAVPNGGYRVRCGLRCDPPILDQAAESLRLDTAARSLRSSSTGRTLTLIGAFIAI
jgi:hypothetical protein